ncbi:juvenile hormone esterase-like [Sabethes cyaneus]|uniref:juvenile hormone esterase-like n=1 Tax=Sabethes cyaneus TaxID=53552 RepID=UPI00237E9209|nr:juvenile hormone esterase-like [Sabethes cyaneus]
MMAYFLAILFLMLAHNENILAHKSCVVKFDSSTYGVGVRNETFSSVSYCVYLGVRYAVPPKGSFRFKNPILHDPVGIQNYTVAGNNCPQRKDINKADNIVGDEDCLFMNIYTPSVIINGSFVNTKYPVLVYIHGGTFMAGSAVTDIENGPDLLIDNGVLVVSINYRLYTLGFLRHTEYNVPGNFGLKDQRTALQWIQKYIKLFGGDPQRVTLSGQSAGAGSVTFHMYANSSAGLFQQAIVLGGSMLAPWALNYHPNPLANEVSARFNATSIEGLQHIDARQFIFEDGFDTFGFFTMFYPGFIPTVEDKDDTESFLTLTPFELVLNKPVNQVPVVIEHTATEFELLLYYANFFFMGNNFPNNKNKTLLKHIRKSLVHQVKLLQDANFIRRLANTANLYYPIKRLLRHLTENMDSVPVYYLRFEFDGRFGYAKNEYYKTKTNGSRYGAVHGDELGYIFSPYNLQDALVKRNEYRLEWKVHERTVELIANFIKYGNPTPKKSKISNIVWPAYNGNSTYQQYLNIDEVFEIRMDNDETDDYFVFWESIYECLYYFNCESIEEESGDE